MSFGPHGGSVAGRATASLAACYSSHKYSIEPDIPRSINFGWHRSTAFMPKQLPIHLIDFVSNNAIVNSIGIKLGGALEFNTWGVPIGQSLPIGLANIHTSHSANL